MSVDSVRPRLREYRSQLGWTQQQLADRLAHLAWTERREHVAVNADMVAKWERGVKGVSPRYRELLCRVFGATADQLGLKNAPAPAAARDGSAGGDESLVGLLDEVAQLLDRLGAAGGALAPHMLHAWKDAVATRRTLLGLLDPARTDPDGRARVATASTPELEQLAERYQALYDTADPATLLTPVVAHLRMTAAALGRATREEERRRLLRNQARVAVLAGRLAAEDLGDPLSGRAYFGLGGDSAREAGDGHLTAVAHGFAAQLAAFEGMSTAALDHIVKATECRCADPAVVGWLAAVEARIHADRGECAAAHEALERAHAASSADCVDVRARDAGTVADLAAATGHVRLRAGDHRGARDAFTAALGRLPGPGRRRRVLALVELAMVELRDGDPTAACARATEAAELLQRAPYAWGAARLRAFRDAAERPVHRGALRALDEQLGRIAA